MLTATAGEVLMHGLRSLQTSRTAWASSSALPGEERFVQSIKELVAAMQRLTQSPFIGESLEAISPEDASSCRGTAGLAAAQTAKFREAVDTL